MKRRKVRIVKASIQSTANIQSIANTLSIQSIPSTQSTVEEVNIVEPISTASAVTTIEVKRDRTIKTVGLLTRCQRLRLPTQGN